MKFYQVSFQWSDNVYCANIAEAESAEKVAEEYKKYGWYSIKEASAYDVEEARIKGMPIVRIN